MISPKLFFTSESVTEGHPDKICDQVSDAVLDAMIAQDPDARVACECATTTGLIIVMGEITTSAQVDIAKVARETIRDIGYTRAKYGFDWETCGVIVSIKEQSADIAMGVDRALEAKTGEMSDEDIEAIGAGDQGMMIGFACNETPELMPMPIMLAHKLTKQLAHARKNGALPYLRPDGKSQVTVEYQYGIPKRVDTVVVSTQHAPEVEQSKIQADVYERV
ncbi:MAG: S-adenosylmethionine synthetase N-terminal domain-containing protein, partial [Anaerolineae bacterium]